MMLIKCHGYHNSTGEILQSTLRPCLPSSLNNDNPNARLRHRRNLPPLASLPLCNDLACPPSNNHLPKHSAQQTQPPSRRLDHIPLQILLARNDLFVLMVLYTWLYLSCIEHFCVHDLVVSAECGCEPGFWDDDWDGLVADYV